MVKSTWSVTDGDICLENLHECWKAALQPEVWGHESEGVFVLEFPDITTFSILNQDHNLNRVQWTPKHKHRGLKSAVVRLYEPQLLLFVAFLNGGLDVW